MAACRINSRTLLAPLLCLVLLSGCRSRPTEKVDRTPEEAFAAASTAVEKEDWKGFCSCLTDDSQDMLAGRMFMYVFMVKWMTGSPGTKPEDKAKVKAFDDVLAKHGLTEEAFKEQSKEAAGDPKGPDVLENPLKGVVAAIKDRPAFVADVMAAIKQLDARAAEDMSPLPKDAELKDLQVEGDTAKAVLVKPHEGKEKRKPIQFRKVGNSWKIELPDDQLKMGAVNGRNQRGR
jgi:hypothetical protein